MSEIITKFGLGELTTLRFSIGGVASEMPLDLATIAMFLREQVLARRIDQHEEGRLMALVTELVRSKELLGKIGIQFVLPAQDRP